MSFVLQMSSVIYYSATDLLLKVAAVDYFDIHMSRMQMILFRQLNNLHKREECHLSLTCCIRLRHNLSLLILHIIVAWIFLIVKKPSDFVVVLSEVNVRILFNILYNISNDILKMPREYKVRGSAGRRELFLDYCVSFVRTFYTDNVCPLLKPTVFCVCIRILR